MELVGW